MTRIAVLPNTLVDYNAEAWRLIQLNNRAEPKLLLEAKSGLSLRFSGAFAVSRDLPETGEVLVNDLGQVLLGWSRQSTSWQLGITLSEEISLARNSRWFEILRFTDEDPDLHEAKARQLGEALAATLGIPFITRDEIIEQEPAPQPVPLAELPLDLGMWQMERTEAQSELQLRRQSRWKSARRRQIAWYALWMIIYIWVALATLGSDLGLPNAGTLIPNPDWLPYLALVVAALLLLQILRQLWVGLRATNTIVFNPYSKSIRGLHGNSQRWQISAGGVQSVYVSEIVKPAGRGRLPFTGSAHSTYYHGEINLHLLDGSYVPVLLDQVKRTYSLLPGAAEPDREDGVWALEASEANTALQMAALHISQTLGELPVWYDRRHK
ncbi:MAG: hypothetical protein OXE46_11850 [Chloroflexi bacterium]|nr:hypothetical protein [Chloroflexota bacterium]